jgi:hypothetical protein
MHCLLTVHVRVLAGGCADHVSPATPVLCSTFKDMDRLLKKDAHPSLVVAANEVCCL